MGWFSNVKLSPKAHRFDFSGSNFLQIKPPLSSLISHFCLGDTFAFTCDHPGSVCVFPYTRAIFKKAFDWYPGFES